MSQSPMARISPFHAVALSWVPTTSLGLNLGFGGGAGDCSGANKSTRAGQNAHYCYHRLPISGRFWGIQVEKVEHVFRKRPINNHFKRCACVSSKSKHNTCDRSPCFLVRIIVHSYLWFLWHEMPMLPSCCIFSGRFISFMSFICCFMGCFSMFPSLYIPLGWRTPVAQSVSIPWTTGSASSRRLGCGLSSTQP